MKEMFRNKVGYNTACIKVRTQDKVLELFYHLSDNPVQHQWQEFHSVAKQYKTHPSYKLSIAEITEILYVLARQKNFTITLPLDQDQLNYIHSKFVENRNCRDQVWDDINTYVHIAEDKLDNFNDFNSTIFFEADPKPTPKLLDEKFKLWLTADQSWGDLQLGYATVGKGWEDIADDDDGLEDLKIQSTISSETRIHFNVEPPWKKFNENKFYEWANNRIDVPLDNLNKLSLGRYYLGKIIITDSFLEFHSNASDWYVPNHSCKLRWNKTMIGSDVEVMSVEFFDSDMYYNTIIKHTGFNNV